MLVYELSGCGFKSSCSHIKSWLETPIAGTLDIIQLSKRKLVSAMWWYKLDSNVVRIYYDRNFETSLQQNQFKSIKEVAISIK